MLNRMPLVVSYGMGLDSTAMLVGMVHARIRPDLILFADTGCERPWTYEYFPHIQAYLARHGYPPVTVVRHFSRLYGTLYDECVRAQDLPPVKGPKKCSLKWKRGVMDPYARSIWPEGKILRAIGYDAGDADTKRLERLARAAKAKAAKKAAERAAAAAARGELDVEPEVDEAPTDGFEYWYPLREWGWDRARSMAEVAAAGLPPCWKSSCFFCPSVKPGEIRVTVREYPHLADMIIHMETLAIPHLRKFEGLWNKRRKDGRPGSISEFIRMIRAGRDDPRILDATESVLEVGRLAGSEDGCIV